MAVFAPFELLVSHADITLLSGMGWKCVTTGEKYDACRSLLSTTPMAFDSCYISGGVGLHRLHTSTLVPGEGWWPVYGKCVPYHGSLMSPFGGELR